MHHSNQPSKLNIWVIALLLLATLNCFAASHDNAHAPANLAPSVAVLEDASKQLSIDDVRKLENTDAFKPWTGNDDIHFGFTTSAHWLRIPINQLGGDAGSKVLEIPYAQISEISFYAPNKAPIVTGSRHPITTRAYFHRFFAFPIEPTDTPRYAYLRVASDYALTVPIKLWQENDFYQHQQKTLMVQFLYYGGLLTLLIYNLFLFISLKNRQFLYYALFAGLCGLGMLAGNGYGRLLLWSDFAKFDNVSQTVLFSLTSAMGAVFTSAFLSTREKLPRTHRLLIIGAALFVFVAAFLLVTLWVNLPTTWAFQLFALNGIFTFFCIILAGIQSIKLGYKPARFFSLAWGVLFAGVTIASLRAFGLVASNIVTEYILQISSSIEMLVFSLALAAMIAEEKIQREVAQARTLNAENTLVKTLETSKENLEKLVAERTQELEVSLAQEKMLRSQYVRFSALIAHEFRNPLSIIQSQISLLRKEDQQGTNQIEKRSNIILETTQRLALMFDSWLDKGRVENALNNLSMTTIELKPWLATLISKHLAISNKVLVEMKFATHIKTVKADASLLKSALKNLIDNAAKYSSTGSTITIATIEKPGYLGIAVTDQGIGIAPRHQEKVFTEYFRVSPEGTTTGTGLGLALVKEIAKAHHGEVELKSKLNKGSTFTIWIPTTPVA
jgi:signal transduction histidine kinase